MIAGGEKKGEGYGEGRGYGEAVRVARRLQGGHRRWHNWWSVSRPHAVAAHALYARGSWEPL